MEPIKGRGIVQPSADKALIAALKEAVKNGQYATLYLYPDSHEVFGKLKDALSESSISYGLEFVEQNKEMVFGAEGTKPPKL